MTSGSLSSYFTLRGDARPCGEFTMQRSRFIAYLAHVENQHEAEAFIAEIRAQHHDARHNVPAWILANGCERASDDGEPQRTAGMPVLDVLRGAALADVCCVVTRYFGGILLGSGGLVRAYTAAAQVVLDVARKTESLVEMRQIVPVVVCVSYAMYERVRDMATRLGGRIQHTDFAAEVELTLAFISGDEEAFVASMRNLMRGSDVCEVMPATFGPF